MRLIGQIGAACYINKAKSLLRRGNPPFFDAAGRQLTINHDDNAPFDRGGNVTNFSSSNWQKTRQIERQTALGWIDIQLRWSREG